MTEPMNQLTEEQRKRLLQQLVETPAGERIRMKCGAADLRSVITDLLALLDSQAAEDRPRPLPKWFVCIDPDEIPLVVALLRDRDRTNEHKEARLHLALCAHCKGFVDAVVTAMRDACVATLRQIAADYDNVAQPNNGAAISKQAVLYAARQIESLTPDLASGDPL